MLKQDTALAIALREAAKKKGVDVKDLAKPTPPAPTQPHDSRNTISLASVRRNRARI
jgi:hypothetical protein